MRDRRVSVIDCLEPAWQAHQSLRRSRTFTLQENRAPRHSVQHFIDADFVDDEAPADVREIVDACALESHASADEPRSSNKAKYAAID